jgi:hypothetical protein
MIVLCSEFNWEYIKTQFSFQQGNGGRGLFLILYVIESKINYKKLVLEYLALTMPEFQGKFIIIYKSMNLAL